MTLADGNDIRSLGTIMGVWAHPDDEAYVMGGIYAQASMNGQNTVCITATRGEQGVQDESRWPKTELAEIRTRELSAALKILGVDRHHWLEYADGKCAEVDPNEASLQIAKLIEDYSPDSIFTFGPEGMTGHEDHKAVSSWVSLALEKSKTKAVIYHCVMTPEAFEVFKPADEAMNMFFNIDEPCLCKESECDVYFKLNEDMLDKKIDAIKAMPSQTESMINYFEDFVREGFCCESFVELDTKGS